MAAQNPYRNISKVLHELGISATPSKDHQSHFHIYLKPPALEHIAANLLAHAPGADTAAQATDPQALLDYAQTLIEGEEFMFTLDVPYVPAYDTPIVLAQAAAGSATPTAILNECQEIDHQKEPTSAFHAVDPAYMIKNYFQPTYNIDLSDIKVTLLQGTQHGTLTEGVSTLGRVAYRYDPAPGYLGDDQAKFMAELELGGKHLRIMIIVQIKVLESVNERAPTCPDPVMIKAPKPATGDSGYSTGYNLAAVSVTFADLAGGVLGQTNANGITLDDNAAGNGWYIDSNPWDNREIKGAAFAFDF